MQEVDGSSAKTPGKSDFIVNITGLVMVLPASSDKWKALCVVKQQPQEQQQKSHEQDILQRHL